MLKRYYAIAVILCVAIGCIPGVALADESESSDAEATPVWQQCEDGAGNYVGDSVRLVHEHYSWYPRFDAPPAYDADIARLMAAGNIEPGILRVILEEVDANTAKESLGALQYSRADAKTLAAINESSIQRWDWVELETPSSDSMQDAIDELWASPAVKVVAFKWKDQDAFSPEKRTMLGLTEKPLAANFPQSEYVAADYLTVYFDADVDTAAVSESLAGLSTVDSASISWEHAEKGDASLGVEITLTKGTTIQDAIDELWTDDYVRGVGPGYTSLPDMVLCTSTKQANPTNAPKSTDERTPSDQNSSESKTSTVDDSSAAAPSQQNAAQLSIGDQNTVASKPSTATSATAKTSTATQTAKTADAIPIYAFIFFAALASCSLMLSCRHAGTRAK